MSIDITGAGPEMVALRMRLWREALPPQGRTHQQIGAKMHRNFPHSRWKNGHIKVANWENPNHKQVPTLEEIDQLDSIWEITHEYVARGTFSPDTYGNTRMPKELINKILGGALDESRGGVANAETPFRANC